MLTTSTPSHAADQDIVRRDPSLPGLGLLLDDAALLQVSGPVAVSSVSRRYLL